MKQCNECPPFCAEKVSEKRLDSLVEFDVNINYLDLK